MAQTAQPDAAILDLIIANHVLANEGVIDDFGHVSARHPSNPQRFFLSAALPPALVTRADIIEFDLEGTPIDQKGRDIYSERFIHAAIYKSRPDVNCVVHHHARAILPFSVADVPLRPLFHLASVIGDEVPVWDSQAEFGDTRLLVDSMEMAMSLARMLGDGSCALLRGHGAVCAEASIFGACFVAVRLRENAQLDLDTRLLGQAPIYLTKGEIEMTRQMNLAEKSLSRATKFWKSRAGYGAV